MQKQKRNFFIYIYISSFFKFLLQQTKTTTNYYSNNSNNDRNFLFTNHLRNYIIGQREKFRRIEQNRK